MIIVMKSHATAKQIEDVVQWIESVGYKAHPSSGVERTIIGAVGDNRDKAVLKYAESLPGVEKTMPILKPYKLASRESHEGDTVINIGSLEIGGPEFIVMAGPCAIESEEQLLESAYVVKKGGGQILRGGAFKPRTSPYSFQGLEEEGLKVLDAVSRKTGLPTVTEVVNPADVDLVESYADVLQIGARNVQNFALLKKVGHARKPVTHLPVVIDPSHAAGNWKYVIPLSRAAVAVGADGIIVEVHPEPEKAVSDGAQSLKPEKFYQLMDDIRALAKAMRS
ncbi:MAG: 3-deoxy-7-phosphoheptulonate synthase [Deltaproteobacteria bacterium HGW-Deltaproteobacteria-1]|nr:MAG: 3-deoxy-7-phosphoheptulonate synthase [Deltaproteobacteria bacterium HGW-Deltaproteobacteria-1]